MKEILEIIRSKKLNSVRGISQSVDFLLEDSLDARRIDLFSELSEYLIILQRFRLLLHHFSSTIRELPHLWPLKLEEYCVRNTHRAKFAVFTIPKIHLVEEIIRYVSGVFQCQFIQLTLIFFVYYFFGSLSQIFLFSE